MHVALIAGCISVRSTISIKYEIMLSLLFRRGLSTSSSTKPVVAAARLGSAVSRSRQVEAKKIHRFLSTEVQDEEYYSSDYEEELRPYRGKHHAEALPEIFLQDSQGGDERLWVPQTDKISFRPLCLSVAGGYYTVSLTLVVC